MATEAEFLRAIDARPDDEVWASQTTGQYARVAPSFLRWYEAWLDDLQTQHEIARAPGELNALAKAGPDGLREVLGRTAFPNPTDSIRGFEEE